MSLLSFIDYTQPDATLIEQGYQCLAVVEQHLAKLEYDQAAEWLAVADSIAIRTHHSAAHAHASAELANDVFHYDQVIHPNRTQRVALDDDYSLDDGFDSDTYLGDGMTMGDCGYYY